MPQDGIFISKLAQELNSSLVSGRIDTIDGLNKTDFCFKIRVPGISYNLYMSISYNNPTIFITKEKFEKPETTSAFTMFLRKHFEGGYIKSIKEYNNDRVIMIEVECSNEFDGTYKSYICLELIGRFSNLLILDENFKIIEAIKQLSVFENNSRGVMKGMTYIPLKNEKTPISDSNTLSIKLSNNDNLYPKYLTDNISGFSPQLSEYLVESYKKSNENNFYNFIIKELKKYNPVVCEKDFYYFNIFSSSKCISYNTISEVLYDVYKNQAEAKILKDNNQKIFQTVSSNIKRLTKKIDKLTDELEKDKNSDEYRLKGELLLANIYKDNGIREKTIKVLNYYDNTEISIQIDPSKSIKENSNLYYKKYKKSKLALEHLFEQIDIAKGELEYFRLLEYQLNSASLKDLIEIKNELILNGYIINKEKPSKKKIKPNYKIVDFEGCKIYIGKNNLQNDFITHTLAKKDDLWFHVKNSHGSHVVVNGDNKYKESVIREAARYAAIYSDSKDSSSVPIDYTEIKYLKKVPGRKGSFVTYKKNKTIYIDPIRDTQE